MIELCNYIYSLNIILETTNPYINAIIYKSMYKITRSAYIKYTDDPNEITAFYLSI